MKRDPDRYCYCYRQGKCSASVGENSQRTFSGAFSLVEAQVRGCRQGEYQRNQGRKRKWPQKQDCDRQREYSASGSTSIRGSGIREHEHQQSCRRQREGTQHTLPARGRIRAGVCQPECRPSSFQSLQPNRYTQRQRAEE